MLNRAVQLSVAAQIIEIEDVVAAIHEAEAQPPELEVNHANEETAEHDPEAEDPALLPQPATMFVGEACCSVASSPKRRKIWTTSTVALQRN